MNVNTNKYTVFLFVKIVFELNNYELRIQLIFLVLPRNLPCVTRTCKRQDDDDDDDDDDCNDNNNNIF